MSLVGVIVTYACCWWLVLFMVLPWRVKLEEKPAPGHARSAPANPMLWRKVFITSGLAILPTIVIYLWIGSARAAEPDMYSTRSDCAPVAHQPRADIAASDTATIADGGTIMGQVGEVYVGIDAPVSKYGNATTDEHIPYSQLYLGAMSVSPDGTARYNGRSISQQPANGNDCNR